MELRIFLVELSLLVMASTIIPTCRGIHYDTNLALLMKDMDMEYGEKLTSVEEGFLTEPVKRLREKDKGAKGLKMSLVETDRRHGPKHKKTNVDVKGSAVPLKTLDGDMHMDPVLSMEDEDGNKKRLNAIDWKWIKIYPLNGEEWLDIDRLQKIIPNEDGNKQRLKTHDWKGSRWSHGEIWLDVEGLKKIIENEDGNKIHLKTHNWKGIPPWEGNLLESVADIIGDIIDKFRLKGGDKKFAMPPTGLPSTRCTTAHPLPKLNPGFLPSSVENNRTRNTVDSGEDHLNDGTRNRNKYLAPVQGEPPKLYIDDE